jgi:hypothetical protein
MARDIPYQVIQVFTCKAWALDRGLTGHNRIAKRLYHMNMDSKGTDFNQIDVCDYHPDKEGKFSFIGN